MASTNHIECVAIVGASGNIGRTFATALIATGRHTVTALTRQGSTTTPVPGAHTVAVDYTSHANLVAALKNQQFLIITLPPTGPSSDLHAAVVRAAADAGVPYVMPNIFGGDYSNPSYIGDPFIARLYNDKLNDLSAAGYGTHKRPELSYIVLVCGQWYEWSLALGKPWFGFDIRKREATLYDRGETPICVSTWETCGAAIAGLLSLPESGAEPCVADWKNKPLYVTSFRITQRDMLDSLHRCLETTDADWKIDYEGSKERYERGVSELKGGSFLGFATALYARVFYPGDSDWEEKLVNSKLGLPERADLDEATNRAIKMVNEGFVEEVFKSFSGN